MNVTVISNLAAVKAAVSEAKKRALEICGGKAETYAKMNSPVKTGWLRDHFTHTQSDEDTEVIGNNVEYAPYVEFGHAQQPGRYVPAIGKRLVADHVDGKYMLTRAIEDHMSEYQEIVNNEFRKII